MFIVQDPVLLGRVTCADEPEGGSFRRNAYSSFRAEEQGERTAVKPAGTHRLYDDAALGAHWPGRMMPRFSGSWSPGTIR
jgi:hypothetical protein